MNAQMSTKEVVILEGGILFSQSEQFKKLFKYLIGWKKIRRSNNATLFSYMYTGYLRPLM